MRDDDPQPATPGPDASSSQGSEEETSGRRRIFAPLSRSDEEHRAERLARLTQQWAQLRAERRAPPVITTGPSNFSRAQVPWGLDLAAAWSWRLIVIAIAGLGVLWTLRFFAVVTVPLAIALLAAALASPLVRALHRIGLPRGLSAGLVMVLGLTTVGLLLTFVGQQVAQGANDLADSVVTGVVQVREWMRTGPLDVSDNQIDTWIKQAQDALSAREESGGVARRVSEVGTAVGHVLAGFFIVLFATYFFMADGDRIWAWLVRLAPRAARERVDESGHVAWVSLTQFVRATVLVALADALGVMAVAALLGVPFVMALGVLVFLGAFVPMIGATVAGSVAVLVALVDQGPLTALLMLGGVILVQQVEGHILQPFLMGRFVSLHPLGVIVAIGCGVLLAGVTGALVAVPLAAAGNAVVQHLARNTEVGDDEPHGALDHDLSTDGIPRRPVPANDSPIGDRSPDLPVTDPDEDARKDTP